MLPELQQHLLSLLQAAVHHTLPEATPVIKLERPKQADHGDIASNVAMQIAKPARRNPRELAQEIVAHVLANPAAAGVVESADVAGPGFINLRLTQATHQQVLHAITQQGGQYGNAARRNEKVIVEFVSANPTGPLHVGHARQAALGDCVCRLLDAGGYDVLREFYYNDAGNQIHNLAVSTQARARGISPDDAAYPSDGYRGEYIADIARDYVNKATVVADDRSVTASGDLDALEDIRQFAVACLRREQDLDLQAFGLKFDNYYLESSLYSDGKVEDTVNKLIASGYTYEHENALWLKTTELAPATTKTGSCASPMAATPISYPT